MGKAVIKQVATRQRIGTGLPLNFARLTHIDKIWRWASAGCLALSVIPISMTLSMGWIFALRIILVCALGAWRPQILPVRIAILAVDLLLLLWWMFSGYPQAPQEVALAVFILAVSFKALELRHVGDGYMASAMCFLGPFLAIVQSLPWWALAGSSFSIVAALLLRSGLACIESGLPTGKPWDMRHWRPVVGLVIMSFPLAIVVFWLLPRLSAPLLGDPKIGRTGISDSMAPGSMNGMLRDPSQALLVSFKGVRPEKSKIYWRATTLSVFDGRTWSQLPLSPTAEILPVSTQESAVFSYEMIVQPQQSNYIPFMDRALSVDGDGVIQTYTLTYMSTAPPGKMKYYAGLSSPDATWELKTISDQARRGNLTLPEGFNPKTIALVEKWKSQGYQGQRMIDHALGYFRNNMSYSYTPPLLGRNSVDELLFNSRQGFCEHFSSSFTFMMRAAGIPARVVTGYHGGRQMNNGKWQVQQFDAHAWSEVWLADQGWVRIDPTFAVVKTLPPPPGQEKYQSSNPLVQWAFDKSSDWFGEFNSQRQQGLFSKWKFENWLHWVIALIGMLILLSWALSAFLWEFRHDPSPPEVVQFEKLRRRLLSQTNLGPSATPRQLSKAMEDLLPEPERGNLALVLKDWESWRYAGTEQKGLAKRLRRARHSLRHCIKPCPRRWRHDGSVVD